MREFSTCIYVVTRTAYDVRNVIHDSKYARNTREKLNCSSNKCMCLLIGISVRYMCASVIPPQMVTIVKKTVFQEQKGDVDRQFSELLLLLIQVYTQF